MSTSLMFVVFLGLFGCVQGSGSYVRWGRTYCPKGAQFVYKGFIGGPSHNQPGGSAKPICLPEHPEYGYFAPGQNKQGTIYGTNYELIHFFKHLHNRNAPCVVCRTIQSTILMIPAKKTCAQGWKREYHGYLMSGLYGNYPSAEYICLDGEPEYIRGGTYGQDGSALSTVEARCGVLPCSLYDNQKELTCVVCSV